MTRSQITEKGAEPFLLEVPVVGENFGQPILAHRLHGDAIREAIAFVRPRSVKSQASKKLPALRQYTNARVIENELDIWNALRRIGSALGAKKVRYSDSTSSGGDDKRIHSF